MIDTHCHLTSKQLISRVQDVIQNAYDAGVERMITVATDGADAIAARDVSRSDPRIFFSSGIHPLYADGDWRWDLVKEAALDPKCVAWGELGLDRHYDEPLVDLQLKMLEEHIALIEDAGKVGGARPIIVHCRKAVADLLPIFKASTLAGDRFVFHCFTETAVEAERILDFGAMISFTGVVTYKNAAEVVAAARLIPLDRIMVETDAPYLTPEPKRKIRPNEPQFVIHTAEFLANLRGIAQDRFEEQLDRNATHFFKLP